MKQLLFILFFTTAMVQAATVKNLRCEGLVAPLGVDIERPQLSWMMSEGEDPSKVIRNQRQTAYQVLVASSVEKLAAGEGDLWNSGKVESDQSIGVVYAGKPLKSSVRCFWKIRIWDKNGKPSSWSEPSQWSMGLLKPEDWTAKWISNETGGKKLKVNQENIPAPWFRKEFVLDAVPSSACITINTPCYFELYVNGEKFCSDVLTPAVSDLNRQTFSLTYNIAGFLHSGQNCIGLWVGNGWSDTIALRAQLEIKAGNELIRIGTDRSWKTRSGNLIRIGKRVWNNFGGELLDAGNYLPNWAQPGIDSAGWVNSVEISPVLAACSNQSCPANHIGERIGAVAVTPLSEGRYEIDFGTNLTGWLNLRFAHLTNGQKVRLYFADRIFPDGVQKSPIGDIGIQMQSCGSFPRADGGTNLYQHYNQISEFISAGQTDEVFQNKFNYAGFRYVVVEGLTAAPKKEDATALLVESNLESAGSFECSDSLLNRIHAVNRWTQRSLNLGGYYVDCPHRERMGYGDGQVALQGMMMNFDAANYYEKWVQDWRQALEMKKEKLPYIAPHFNDTGGGPPWPGGIARIPWQHYLHYGNIKVLEDNIDAARQYCKYLDSRSKDDVLRSWGGGFSFIGDWVPPDRGMDTSNWPSQQMAEFFCNCYRVHLWQLVEKMAVALGRSDDADVARKRADAICTAVHAAFYDSVNKRYVIDEQIYYVFPLLVGVTPESDRQAVLDNLLRCITVKNKGHLDTGMLGTMLLMEYLNEIGRDDLVLGIYQKKDYPGWGYMVEQGATTMWEQWNGYWSQIHSCFTSADNWLYEGLAGIRPDPSAPGFKNVIIKPAVVGNITWVKAHHDSPYGRIAVDWGKQANALSLKVEIPANTTATVYVPASSADQVSESGIKAEKAKGVKFLRMEKKAAVYHVGSGSYTFKSSVY